MKSHTYPKSVYHKDFDHINATEATLKLHCKLVHNEAALKELGPDWGDHPASKHVEAEPTVEEIVVDGHKELKKQLKKVK